MKIPSLLLGALVAASAFQPVLAADVGVSISIAQPGFYGRIDLGGAPPPALIYPQPVLVVPAQVPHRPIYLRVPPGQERHWERYCERYGACNQPVYFVQDRWYREVYEPRVERMGPPGLERREQRWDERHDRGHHNRFEREREHR